MENVLAAGGLAFAIVTWLLALSFYVGRMAEKLDNQGKRLDRGDDRFKELISTSHLMDKDGVSIRAEVASLKQEVHAIKAEQTVIMQALRRIEAQNRKLYDALARGPSDQSPSATVSPPQGQPRPRPAPIADPFAVMS